jgi:hypothetical protein
MSTLSSNLAFGHAEVTSDAHYHFDLRFSGVKLLSHDLIEALLLKEANISGHLLVLRAAVRKVIIIVFHGDCFLDRLFARCLESLDEVSDEKAENDSKREVDDLHSAINNYLNYVTIVWDVLFRRWGDLHHALRAC